jgi:hypothetical protein
MRGWRRCIRRPASSVSRPTNCRPSSHGWPRSCSQLADATDLDGLRKQEPGSRRTYLKVARQLSATRAHRRRAQLGEQVTKAMQDLNDGRRPLRGGAAPCEPVSQGVELVEFMVAGHAGVAPRPLAKVASGGELARISLAISVITSNATTVPTLIFDEVDSAASAARVAEVVGRLLKRLGQERQVLCVTHLPQVASQGNSHFQVAKRHGGKRQDRLAHRGARCQGPRRGSGAHAGRPGDHRHHPQARPGTAGVLIRPSSFHYSSVPCPPWGHTPTWTQAEPWCVTSLAGNLPPPPGCTCIYG